MRGRLETCWRVGVAANAWNGEARRSESRNVRIVASPLTMLRLMASQSTRTHWKDGEGQSGRAVAVQADLLKNCLRRPVIARRQEIACRTPLHDRRAGTVRIFGFRVTMLLHSLFDISTVIWSAQPIVAFIKVPSAEQLEAPSRYQISSTGAEKMLATTAMKDFIRNAGCVLDLYGQGL